jgi:hypothetical protein
MEEPHDTKKLKILFSIQTAPNFVNKKNHIQAEVKIIEKCFKSS